MCCIHFVLSCTYKLWNIVSWTKTQSYGMKSLQKWQMLFLLGSCHSDQSIRHHSSNREHQTWSPSQLTCSNKPTACFHIWLLPASCRGSEAHAKIVNFTGAAKEPKCMFLKTLRDTGIQRKRTPSANDQLCECRSWAPPSQGRVARPGWFSSELFPRKPARCLIMQHD